MLDVVSPWLYLCATMWIRQGISIWWSCLKCMLTFQSSFQFDMYFKLYFERVVAGCCATEGCCDLIAICMLGLPMLSYSVAKLLL